ncbi:MAG: tRNA (adenosine(37)-N6)-threonylcarbamoyltransferase complex dimerization subunit type 1 TsaB, partial [Rudaea sp.]
ARENHTVALMPQLVRLLELTGVRLKDLSRIAVAIGPGSFTGLRIGLSLAKGLALSRGLSISGIPTLDGLAAACLEPERPVWALLQAGRGRYAAALYELRDACPARVSDYLVVDGEHLVSAARNSMRERHTARILFCGELDATLRATLETDLVGRADFASHAVSLRRAAYLAEVAWNCPSASVEGTLDTLTPYYIPTASLPQTVGA